MFNDGHDALRERLAALLKELPPGVPFGTELFDAFMRIGPVGIAYEAVALRQGKQGIEIYLVQRSPDDTAYPDEWHCPGTYQRCDEQITDVFARLAEREFGAPITGFRLVGLYNNPAEVRGTTASIVFLVQVEAESEVKGHWYLVTELPDKTVSHHKNAIIPMAMMTYSGLTDLQLMEAPRG